MSVPSKTFLCAAQLEAVGAFRCFFAAPQQAREAIVFVLLIFFLSSVLDLWFTDFWMIRSEALDSQHRGGLRVYRGEV